MAGDAAYVASFLTQRTTGPVVLVGHSYGGVMITNAGPWAVTSRRSYTAPEGDAEAFLKPSTVHESVAQDLPEADRWLIVASQRPITLGANTAPTQTAAWKTVPSWTVIGTEDRVIPRPRNAAWRSGRDALPDALKPGFHCVRTHWIQGFMAFQLVRRIRTAMLMVPVCPESGFLDVPHGRGPLAVRH